MNSTSVAPPIGGGGGGGENEGAASVVAARRESRNGQLKINRFRETQTEFDAASISVRNIMGKCEDFSNSKLNFKIKTSMLK